MAIEGAKGAEQAVRLQVLTDRLNKAIDNGRDLTKDKYQRYLKECIGLRDELETQALQSLENEDSKFFEGVAEVIHSASAVITQVKEKQVIDKEHVEVKRNRNPHRSSVVKEEDNWASFPQESDADHYKHSPSKAGLPHRGRRSTADRNSALGGQSTHGPLEPEPKGSGHEGKVNRRNSTMRHSRGSFPSISPRTEDIGDHNSVGNDIAIVDKINPSPLGSSTPVKSKATDKENKSTKTNGNSINIAPLPIEAELATKRGSRGAYRGSNKLDKVLVETVDEDIYVYKTYISSLEKCLMFTDCHKLGYSLMGKTVEEKVGICNAFVDEHLLMSNIAPDHSQPDHEANRSNMKDVLYKVPVFDHMTKTNNFTDGVSAEPLWRNKEDGGVSSYMGRYFTEGSMLFDGMFFIVYLNMEAIRGSFEVAVELVVKPKMHNIDISVELSDELHSSIKVLEYSSSKILFTCEPDVWSYSLPELVVEALESDGTKRTFLVKLPIGPSALLEPIELSHEDIERVMKNDYDVGFYTTEKYFLAKEKIDLPRLITALSSRFYVLKTNTKQMLAAVDNHNRVIVGTIQTKDELLCLNIWSSSEKALSSACTLIKEISAYVSSIFDRRLAEIAMRFIRNFPIDFEGNQSEVRRLTQSALSKPEKPRNLSDDAGRVTKASASTVTLW